jgi:hypothetical protein
MRVKSGWHTRGRLKTTCSTENPQLPEIDFSVFGMKKDEFEADIQFYRLKAGSAAFHHPLLPHSSLPNPTDTPRRAIVLRYSTFEPADVGPPHPHYSSSFTFQRKTFNVRCEKPDFVPPRPVISRS